MHIPGWCKCPFSFLILASSTYVFPLLCHIMPGIRQGVGVKKDLVSLSKAMKEDRVKTMRPGSSVIWPVAKVETVIIACLVRTAVADVPTKKAAIRWGHASSPRAQWLWEVRDGQLQSCSSLLWFFSEALGFLSPRPPAQADWSGEKTRRRSAPCQRPRAGLAQQARNDTISSDLWLKEYREHDHETCHWLGQIGDITVIGGGGLRWAISFQLQCCESIHSNRLCLCELDDLLTDVSHSEFHEVA